MTKYKLDNVESNRVPKWLYFAVAGLIAYTASCIPNTINLNKKLEPVRQEFVKVANQGAKSRDSDFLTGKSKLNYGGSIDDVIRKRNIILEENNGIQLEKWKVSSTDYRDYKDTQNIVVYMPKAFCYSPLAKIK
jgi:hypothetical protein